MDGRWIEDGWKMDWWRIIRGWYAGTILTLPPSGDDAHILSIDLRAPGRLVRVL